MKKGDRYVNRELSWLAFNSRVLEEAENPATPLYERLKFVSIFDSNLSEFFMVRVGSLNDQRLVSNIIVDNKTGLTPSEQLQAIFAYVAQLLPRKDAVYQAISHELAAHGLVRVDEEHLKEKDKTYLSAYFKNEILPVISPSIIDRRHPFPFLQNMELYLGVQLATKGKYVRFGIVPISQGLPRFVRLPGKGYRYCLMEDVISHFAARIFRKFTILDKTIFRITRNADINIQEGLFDEDADYRQAMQALLKTRKKLCPVRLELQGHINLDFQKYMCKKLGLEPAQVFSNHTPLNLKHIFAFEDTVRRILPEELFFPPLAPHKPLFLDETQPVLPQVIKKDVFLSYPFESMQHFIRLLNEAADDPDTVSIKITLYRVARNSKVIDALIRANDRGKQVYAVVELRARFDEQNNIDWATRLEEAGVGLSYGLDDYKTHSKLCLITRRTKEGVQYITQIGTGNYNEKTAAQYTDMILVTANQEIGEDAANFFQNISMGETTAHPKHLLIAPLAFRVPLLALIDEQIQLARSGGDASIIIKINSLTDKPLIDKLMEASRAGVPIRLIVRGICCLRAGVPGMTDNIQVISIVGRYLEHSRIYSFGQGDAQKLYISSGDWMTRSTQSRVEIAAPIYDPDIRKEINHTLALELADNVKARRQLPDGTYTHVSIPGPPVDSQICLFTDPRYKKS